MSAKIDSSWFTCSQPRPTAKWRLVGFPYGGGGPQAFRGWADILPESVELLALNLPGRGSRLGDPLMTEMHALAPAVAQALQPYFDKPLAFFGHSVGALIAFEVARHMQEANLPLPLHLFVSAHKAPHAAAAETALYRLSDDELVEVVRRLGLVPEEALENLELLELILPPLRADFELSETYRCVGESPLRLPILSLGGSADDLVSEGDLRAWAPHTSESFAWRTFEGDHFYTQAHLDELIMTILGRVNADLEELPKSTLCGPEDPYPADKCLHELFAAQAAATPEAIAVVDGHRRLTFGELDALTDLLARYLQAQGVVVDSLVGIHLETSLEYVVAYLASLKAGGAYMPLEVTYPTALLQRTLEASEPVVLLTNEKYFDHLPPDWKAPNRVFSLSAGWAERLGCLELPALDEDRQQPTPDSLAYCVMSSGTTGEPKGIACSHRGAVNSYYWRYRNYPYREGEREACNVFFVWEVVRPLLQGRPVHIIPDDVIFDPPRLVNQLYEDRITRVLFTPSLLEQILNTSGLDLARKFSHLRVVYLNGEVVSTPLQQRFAALFPDITLLNDYSISECHDVCTTDLASLNAMLSPKYAPLGTPMSNVRIYLLDEEVQPVPWGLQGEIYVGGDSLARGYLNAPGETANRFLPDPIRKDGSLVFRTGDTGRILANGQLEIQGRIAFMVKLRGYSIVPSAVESAIVEHPAVESAVVTATNNEETGQPEHLVGYVVGNGLLGDDELMAALRPYLKEKLPHYALPSYLICMAELPLASTGKLDRRRLPEPGAASLQATRAHLQAPPATRLERVIADAWQDLLSVAAVEATDNFFDLGGHSLLAAQLCGRLKDEYGLSVSVIDVFQHPTVRGLAHSMEAETVVLDSGPARVNRPSSTCDIAIVGMACRFPGAPDAESFWRNLREGVCSIRELPDAELDQRGLAAEIYQGRDYVKYGALLDDVDQFDPKFWGVSKKEATLMDPQHRLFLECCWQALEDAGYAPRQNGERTGVFGGTFLPSYLLHYLKGGGLLDPRDPMEQHLTEIGNDKDYLTTRVSHLLNLQGPSVNIQTSCSTSLVAVATACQSLMAQQCDVALAGASSITFPQAGYQYVEGHINARDGQCRPFDSKASGTILGDGLGVVVLKRLDDAREAGDNVLAVIKGFAVNNDGGLKAGYSAPSVQGQARVVAAAQAMAGVEPESISYIECHGTGTLIGDPIEMRALTEVFRRSTDRRQFCAIGSVKAGIGHSNIAAGMAGLIKTVLALHHQQLPPLLNFETPNPELHLEESPFYINDTLQAWPCGDEPRRAGVSCFGIGGTNSHLILEEYAVAAGQGTEPSAPSVPAAENLSEPAHLLTLSAHTPGSLEQSRVKLVDYLRSHPQVDLGDVAYTLHVGREHFSHRLAVAAPDLAAAQTALQQARPANRRLSGGGIAFMFPGQGSQYLGMGRGLYANEPAFRAHYDECAELLTPHLGLDLRSIAFADEGSPEARDAFSSARQVQTALFAVEYALARTLMTWGVTPSALVGHSLGEYVAACLAGVFTLEDALTLVVARGLAMEQAGAGAMLSVKMPADAAHAFVADEPEVDVAVINSGTDIVLSGRCDAIERAAQRLEGSGVACRRVHVGQAFHSPMMAAAATAVAERAKAITLHRPTIPLLSNLTGELFTDEQATDPTYWGRHLRQTVRFADDVQALLRLDPEVLLEVGPGRTLSSSVARIKVDMPAVRRGDDSHPLASADPLVLPCLRHPMEERVSDSHFLKQTLARVWAAGVDLDWQAYHAGRQHQRVPLPAYSFEGERCWPRTASSTGQLALASDAAVDARPDRKLPLDQWFYLPSWRRTAGTGFEFDPNEPQADSAESLRWLVFLDDEGERGQLGETLATALEKRGDSVRRIYRSRPAYPAGTVAQTQSEGGPVPRQDPSYDGQVNLLKGLTEDQYPDRILYLWSLAGEDDEPGLSAHHQLLQLARALTVTSRAEQVQLWVVAEDTVQVDQEAIRPDRASLIGPCLVVAQENPQLTCRLLDVQTTATDKLADEGLDRQILNECAAPEPDSAALVALRGYHRWVPHYEPLSTMSSSGKQRLRSGGVYLITGGLGRIGLVLAEHLAKLPAKLVLTSRSAIPARAEWARLADAPQTSPEQRKILRALLNVEALGGEVIVCQADMAEATDVERILTTAAQTFGRIDGVFHAAGLADLAYLPDLSDDIVAGEFAPKVQGLLNLERAIGGLDEEFQPSFVVLFSSIAAVLGGFGMAAYTAANRFMDAFVQDNPRRHGVAWIDVNWDDWDFEYTKEQVAAYEKTQAHFAMTPAEGLAALDRVLVYGRPPQVVVSTRPLQARLDQWVRQDPQLSPSSDGTEGDAGPDDGQPGEAAQTIGVVSELAGQVAAVYQRVLDLPELALDDNFFDLGGDSLLATQILAGLRRTLSADSRVQLRDIFDYPTVRELAQWISDGA